MSRAAVARELQQVMEELQQGLCRAQQLAKSSGLVDPKWFRGAHSAITMAAGELDQKGLLDRRPAANVEAG